ncbi:cation:proton antiporter [Ottowia testudinis]|uniref:Cation:proton antiporter n=1 Tax=Ottowia testudinis TaxID=2816950 RepID=A0A975CKH9_9BURK|nr:cation:proton antiporter [Ottowia testudinis]QTD45869.1 cation:proton antiporter [Ottowia testudinis]
MFDPSTASWAERLQSTPGPLTLEWALLLALAALAGHLVQRFSGLPKIVGYAVFGTLIGLAGFAGAAWPLHGVGLYLLELGIAVVLFEAGARLSLRWFRHNPMVLVQSLVEALLTFAVAFVLLRALGLDVPVARALAVVSVAASPAVLMRVVSDLRASGPVTDRAIALATLNTLYALTAGTAMLRSIDRGDASLMASLASSAAVLGISLLVGGLLAALLIGAFKLLHPTSQDTAIVILALLGACTAVTTPLGGSAPLATLLAGIVLKQLHPRPWVWPRQLGTAAAMLNVLMFVLVSSMAAQADWGGVITWAALALIAARMSAKLASLLLTGPASGLSLRQSLWVGVALLPMSSVALLLTSQFVVASHGIGARVAAIALPVILITELLGAVLVGLALTRARETVKPWRGADSSGGDSPPGSLT